LLVRLCPLAISVSFRNFLPGAQGATPCRWQSRNSSQRVQPGETTLYNNALLRTRCALHPILMLTTLLRQLRRNLVRTAHAPIDGRRHKTHSLANLELVHAMRAFRLA